MYKISKLVLIALVFVLYYLADCFIISNLFLSFFIRLRRYKRVSSFQTAFIMVSNLTLRSYGSSIKQWSLCILIIYSTTHIQALSPLMNLMTLEGIFISELLILIVLRESYLLQPSLKFILSFLVILICSQRELIRMHNYCLLKSRRGYQSRSLQISKLVVGYLNLW